MTNAQLAAELRRLQGLKDSLQTQAARVGLRKEFGDLMLDHSTQIIGALESPPKSGGEIPVPDFGVWLANIPTGPEGWDGLTERDLRDLWSHLPPPKPEPLRLCAHGYDQNELCPICNTTEYRKAHSEKPSQP